jgi:uncharacterized Zn finger protein
VNAKRPIPLLDEGDELSLVLNGDAAEDAPEDDSPSAPSSGSRDARIARILGNKNREALLDLLVDIANRYPDIRQQIIEADHLARGEEDKLVCSLRREIRNLTAEPAWYDHWRDEGDLPDFSHLENRLRALADLGHADALLELGAELWSRGNAQVGQSNDEGETARAISACLEIVVGALPKSTLSSPEQLLWVVDRMLEDEYSLLDSTERLLKRRCYTRAHWREVAKVLETRLKKMPRPSGTHFSETYHRNRLLDQVIDAYARAGWEERIIPLLEAEADTCRCYTKLADRLLKTGDRERARHRCIQGYEQTISDAPGIAGALQDRLRDLAQSEKRYNLVAAYRAQDFFKRPTERTYQALRKAAEKAKCWPAVRSATEGAQGKTTTDGRARQRVGKEARRLRQCGLKLAQRRPLEMIVAGYRSLDNGY